MHCPPRKSGGIKIVKFYGACSQHRSVNQEPDTCSQFVNCLERHKEHLSLEGRKEDSRQAGRLARREGGRDWERKARRRKQERTTEGKRKISNIRESPSRDDFMEEMSCYSVLSPLAHHQLTLHCVQTVVESPAQPSPSCLSTCNHLLLYAIIPEAPMNIHPLDMGVSVQHSSLCALFGVLPPFFLLPKLVPKHHKDVLSTYAH